MTERAKKAAEHRDAKRVSIDAPVGPPKKRSNPGKRPFRVQVWTHWFMAHWWTVGKYETRRQAEQAFDSYSKNWIGRNSTMRIQELRDGE